MAKLVVSIFPQFLLQTHCICACARRATDAWRRWASSFCRRFQFQYSYRYWTDRFPRLDIGDDEGEPGRGMTTAPEWWSQQLASWPVKMSMYDWRAVRHMPPEYFSYFRDYLHGGTLPLWETVHCWSTYHLAQKLYYNTLSQVPTAMAASNNANHRVGRRVQFDDQIIVHHYDLEARRPIPATRHRDAASQTERLNPEEVSLTQPIPPVITIPVQEQPDHPLGLEFQQAPPPTRWALQRRADIHESYTMDDFGYPRAESDLAAHLDYLVRYGEYGTLLMDLARSHLSVNVTLKLNMGPVAASSLTDWNGGMVLLGHQLILHQSSLRGYNSLAELPPWLNQDHRNWLAMRYQDLVPTDGRLAAVMAADFRDNADPSFMWTQSQERIQRLSGWLSCVSGQFLAVAGAIPKNAKVVAEAYHDTLSQFHRPPTPMPPTGQPARAGGVSGVARPPSPPPPPPLPTTEVTQLPVDTWVPGGIHTVWPQTQRINPATTAMAAHGASIFALPQQFGLLRPAEPSMGQTYGDPYATIRAVAERPQAPPTATVTSAPSPASSTHTLVVEPENEEEQLRLLADVASSVGHSVLDDQSPGDGSGELQQPLLDPMDVVQVDVGAEEEVVITATGVQEGGGQHLEMQE